MAALARSLGRIRRHNTAFLLCDMQEKFKPSICHFPEITAVGKRMVEAAKHLDIPLIATEQYPEGLGATVSELNVPHAKFFAKKIFTMLTPEVNNYLETLEKEQNRNLASVVLFGIETQVCVSQTALDFLELGLDVHVVADGCSSRSMADRMLAFERLRQSGAFITTSEAVLFELLGSSSHPKFKEVQALVRGPVPDSKLVSNL